MSTVHPMSWETYDAHSAEIARVVDTMLDRRDWLKRWRLLAIYEAGEDEALGHVLELRDGAVVIMRTTNDYDQAPATLDDLLDDPRQSRLWLVQPITGEPEQKFQMASRRRTQVLVSARYLVEAIDAGKTKVVLSPGRWTR